MRIVATALVLIVATSTASAEVKRIVIDKKTSPAFDGRSFGSAGQYETLAGRAFGELDPNDLRNRLITDIALAQKNANGKVEYVASFYLVKPIDMSKSSRLMWHDVPNRGGRITIAVQERMLGDIGLSSGWQGDHSGRTVPTADNDWVTVPVAKNADGSPVMGRVLGRIVNASGPASRPMIVNANPVPYRPVTLDTSKATLVTRTGETVDGKVSGERTVPAGDWAWARCTEENPFPGIPDPTQVCVKGGFDPKRLYQVTFTSQDPYVLGVGFAAFRDIASFLRYERQDAEGHPNPLGGQVQWVVSRGRSQSGRFLRAFLHLGFNQDEQGRQVHAGAWPIIASGRLPLNVRFATPDAASKLYEGGMEGPVWWTAWADPIRKLPAASLLDRCTTTKTCPKIMEQLGSTEAWALYMSPSWLGTTAERDLPLPANVRRYYMPSTPHGGGDGGFSVMPDPAPQCPGPGFGRGMLAENPMPYTETNNALRIHLREWVMKDVAPPQSVYPSLANGTLVDPTKAATGFPTIPGLPANAPTGLVSPMLDYDWGTDFNAMDLSGVASTVPPTIRNVMTMKVPKVDADGNELGGVPIVLREAPLGTYLGWNIVADGFHKGKICNYAAGMIPFARTRAERMANDDPRLSLEERYQTHEGYVAAVKAAAAKAVAQKFLLQEDADRLVEAAASSKVLVSTQTAQNAGR
jgi:hypothetical protein